MATYLLLVILVLAMQLSCVSTDVCSIYEDFERNVTCGSNGYLLHYGLRNCRIFAAPETVSRFTLAGQQFLNCTRACLIDHLKNLFEKSRPTCDAIYSSAVESHVPCYLQCGFCNICKTEKLALFASYDLRDFFSFDSIKTIYKVLRKCGPVPCLDLFLQK